MKGSVAPSELLRKDGFVLRKPHSSSIAVWILSGAAARTLLLLQPQVYIPSHLMAS
jgi:hypothetical protein